MRKLTGFLSENGFTSIRPLFNNAYEAEDIAVCGSRGWLYNSEAPEDKKIVLREAGRVEASVRAALETGKKPCVFLHYPPLFQNYICFEMTELLREYNVKLCCYGHIHGSSCRAAYNGWSGGTEYKLVSADWLDFKPFKIEEC